MQRDATLFGRRETTRPRVWTEKEGRRDDSSDVMAAGSAFTWQGQDSGGFPQTVRSLQPNCPGSTHWAPLRRSTVEGPALTGLALPIFSPLLSFGTIHIKELCKLWRPLQDQILTSTTSMYLSISLTPPLGGHSRWVMIRLEHTFRIPRRVTCFHMHVAAKSPACNTTSSLFLDFFKISMYLQVGILKIPIFFSAKST